MDLIVNNQTVEETVQHLQRNKKFFLIGFAGCISLSFLVGFFIAFGYSHSSMAMLKTLNRDTFKSDDHVTEALLSRIDNGSLGLRLRWLAQQEHQTGQMCNKELIAGILDTLYQLDSFDQIQVFNYSVLLSFPNLTSFAHRSRIEVEGSNQVIVPLSDGDHLAGVPYVAFSRSATVTASLVYVNFATESDFITLDSLNIPVKDKILIARFGKIHESLKVANAQNHSAKGLILFPDPQQIIAQRSSTSWNIPQNAIRYASAMIPAGSGDPSTPGWPSISGAFRLLDNPNIETRIPVLSISSQDASLLMSHLDKTDPPDGWMGSLESISYRLTTDSFLKVKLVVNNELRTENISNVIGVMRGSVEPDRYVIIGNHIDSWGFGALHPSSGTAALLELATRLNSIVKDYGWKPRRSILFAFWDAGEFGSVGSTEWVEQLLPILRNRALAYINSDLCNAGTILKVKAHPLLRNVLIDAIEGIPETGQKDEDFWIKTLRHLRKEKAVPVSDLDSESDYVALNYLAGVPSMDIKFGHKDFQDADVPFPSFHTTSDKMELAEMVDPQLQILQSCCRLLAVSVRKLSDSLVVPYDLEGYARYLLNAVPNFEATRLEQQLRKHNISIDTLKRAIVQFYEASQNFTARLKQVDLMNPIKVRMLNDQLMQIERIFTEPRLLAVSPRNSHHILMSSAKFPPQSDVSDKLFPVLQETLETLNTATALNRNARNQIATSLKEHLTLLTVALNQATILLQSHSQLSF